MLLTDPQSDLHSIGHLAALLQKSPRAIEKAAIAEGIAPELRLNGIAHFSEPQIEVLRRQLGAGSPIADRAGGIH